MVDPRRQAFLPYIREIADRLRLRDWTIEVKDDEPDEKSTAAQIQAPFGRKVARFWVSHDFLGDAPEEQRHTIVHELIHCHFMAGWNYAQDLLPNGEAKKAAERFWETGIDGLADAIAPLMPLPGEDRRGPLPGDRSHLPPGFVPLAANGHRREPFEAEDRRVLGLGPDGD